MTADHPTAVRRLGALAQDTRLRVFRLLVEAGPDGLNAGAISEAIGVPANTLSFHIAHLARADLVTARQQGRFIYYAADFTAMDELLGYLSANCCQGAPCLPSLAAAAPPPTRNPARNPD